MIAGFGKFVLGETSECVCLLGASVRRTLRRVRREGEVGALKNQPRSIRTRLEMRDCAEDEENHDAQMWAHFVQVIAFLGQTLRHSCSCRRGNSKTIQSDDLESATNMDVIS